MTVAPRRLTLRGDANGQPMRFIVLIQLADANLAVGPFRSEYAATTWADRSLGGHAYTVLPLEPPGP